MNRSLLSLLVGVASFAPGGLIASSEVGSRAPRLEPNEWLNTDPGMSWSQLKGRVILVEKWATT